MNFPTGETNKYSQYDDLQGNPDTLKSNGATMSQLLVNSSLSLQLAGVTKTATVFQNTYSNGTAMDSDFYSQDANKDLYKVDFGLEPLNNNAAIVNFMGGKAHVGWVLMSKLASPAGATWKAIDQVLHTTGQLGDITLLDNATMQADTTFSFNGKAYYTKHVHHSFSASAALGSAQGEYDIYTAPSIGANVIYWVHPISSSAGSQNGIQNVLTEHTP